MEHKTWRKNVKSFKAIKFLECFPRFLIKFFTSKSERESERDTAKKSAGERERERERNKERKSERKKGKERKREREREKEALYEKSIISGLFTLVHLRRRVLTHLLTEDVQLS